MTRKICFVTGTRAEYGLLRYVMEEVRDAPDLELQLLVTGMHLAPEFGLTYREIEREGFSIDAKVEMLLSADTATGVSKSMALGLIGCADSFARLRPDLVVLLGDRFEVFAAAAAATIACIPIVHLHGGETTEGAFDEAIRHSITKMSHLHFVASDEYRRRVIQLGEQPNRVHMVGGLGVDVIERTKLLDREALEASLDFRLGNKNLLVTFHPVTLESQSSPQQMRELLAALDQLDDTHLIFTMPNADTGNRELTLIIEDFVKAHPNARSYTSLGQVRYLSCLQQVDGVVGNSSSGLAEAPSFGIGTINIGDRQRGRMKAQSVIDCMPERSHILAAVKELYSPTFQQTLNAATNPYGVGGASKKIVSVLQSHPLEGILIKSFYNLGSTAAEKTP